MKNLTKLMSRGQLQPRQLRNELQHGSGGHLRHRRAIVGISLMGMASMAIVSMFQTGIIRHLPDPPSKRFHSDKVNSSDTAYGWDTPDGPVSLAAHAENVVMATLGGSDRARNQPFVPLIAAAKAGAEAAVAAKYLFHQMPFVEKVWCGYCIVDALAHLGTFALTLPEAGKALKHLKSG